MVLRSFTVNIHITRVTPPTGDSDDVMTCYTCLPCRDRTPEEYAEGHAIGAVNIPFLVKSSEGMQCVQFLHGDRHLKQHGHMKHSCLGAGCLLLVPP
jgi:hypothetical protein